MPQTSPSREFPTRRHQWPQGDRPCPLLVAAEPGLAVLSVPLGNGEWRDVPMPQPDDPRRAAFRVELAKAGAFREVRP